MSLDPKTEKRNALEQLRFHKLKKQRTTSSTVPVASSSSSPDPGKPPSNIPPPQSRDGTVPSRYFSSTYRETILVPDSSPLQLDKATHSRDSNLHANDGDVASFPHLKVTEFRPFSMRAGGHDPLSAPSGFVTRHDVSFTNVQAGNDKAGLSPQTFSEHTSPHRRGGSDPLDLFNQQDSPGSPAIHKAGQRRRVASDFTTLSNTSEESLPEVSQAFAGSSKPRIIRRNRPSFNEASTGNLSSSETEDPKFIRFKVTMPQHSLSAIRAAWKQAKGDVREATQLLSQPGWNPNPPSLAQPATETTGKVRELEEASRALRAAMKEKSKKSLIYANRGILEVTTASPSSPPPSKAPVDSVESPLTPIVAPGRRRVRKLVGSDSESEQGGSETGQDHCPAIGRQRPSYQTQAVNFFNTKSSEALQELTGCTSEQAAMIIGMRPFGSVDDLNAKLGQGKKKAGPAGISPRILEDTIAIFEGYKAVDIILEDCEEIASTLRAAISRWTIPDSESSRSEENTNSVLKESEEGVLDLVSVVPVKELNSISYLETQPSLLHEDVQLKGYQLLGVNWLHLLYRRRLSCILADEMGLGKTIQVISFFALLKEQGNMGPHLVVVPSSTLENWCREFARFAPTIFVQTYYAGKDERPSLRQKLLDTRRSTDPNGQGWEVLVTTYALAQGDDRDRKFFRHINWDSCVFDEGHVLKNFESQRYQALLRFPSKWRLLLTGTPLQNNLQELVSLMNFILPSQFAGYLDALRAIFKVKGDAKVTLLAQDRVSRAKKMMTPFVLRRRKDQVLKDLPKKTERIEWCEMTPLQRSIYNDALQRSRKVLVDTELDSLESTPGPTDDGQVKTTKKNARTNQKPKNKVYLENSTNVLMDLRKAASHPMLFRTHFTDQILTGMAAQLMKEPDFKKRQAIFEFVKEDMEVMTDAELQAFCNTYKSINKFLRDEKCYLDAGKVQTLLRLLEEYNKQGRKILIFSQFTQILDILQSILQQKNIKFLVLTGTTLVDVRQSLVDEFTEDESIPVFLLSTKAGGMGINLTAASVVIMFDQDFNPHNDRQAQARAYRIGQKRDVDVIKLITRGSIEEDMLRLGETKLALDEAVAGEGEDGEGKEGHRKDAEVKQSLMNALRDKLLLEEKSERESADERSPSQPIE